ncbi:hypothetical protein Daus18300_005738 [Diaporthe australafricana]|uniref:Uncharacterized protein n=1 Tax=Diaporthe australafricana TaxID=127596 RepID=A0ABR3WZK6_9PEZI
MAKNSLQNRRGAIRCSRCRTWRAQQAFVRSSERHGTATYRKDGFIWTRFKTCNNCACTLKGTPLLSPEEFLEIYGAELHNDSEPDEDDDEDDKSGDNAGNGNGNSNGDNNGGNAGAAVAV